MNVLDIMTENPIVVRAGHSLRQALELMDNNSVKHLPVMSNQGHLIGIVSDRDCRHALNSPYIMRERWQDESLANQLEVRSIMSAAPIVVEPNDPAAEAADRKSVV